MPFVASQRAYRFYEDGTEAGSVAIAAENTAINRNVDTDSLLLLRQGIRESGSGSSSGLANDDYYLHYLVNGVIVGEIGGVGSLFPVLAAVSSNLTDGEATTQRLSSHGTGVFNAGVVNNHLSADPINYQLIANNFTEILYVIKIQSAYVSNGDVITFKINYNTVTDLTNAATPTITVVKTSVPSPGWMGAGGW